MWTDTHTYFYYYLGGGDMKRGNSFTQGQLKFEQGRSEDMLSSQGKEPRTVSEDKLPVCCKSQPFSIGRARRVCRDRGGEQP